MAQEEGLEPSSSGFKARRLYHLSTPEYGVKDEDRTRIFSVTS